MNKNEDAWARLERKQNQSAIVENAPARSANTDVNLRLLAFGYMILMYSLVASIVTFAGFLLTPFFLPNQELAELVCLVFLVVTIVSSVALSAAAVVIAIAQGTILSALLTVIGLLIPCISLFVIYAAYNDAKETLMGHGVKIGFFGVDFSTLPT